MKFLRAFFIMALFILASVRIFAVDNTVETFRNTLRLGNAAQVRQIIAPGGLLLVRTYNPNHPNRGKDMIFRVNDIPDGFQINVPNDLAFDLRYLFGGSIRARSLVYIEDRISGLSLNEGSVQGVRSFAQTVLEFIQDKSRSFIPTAVYSDGRFLVLSEAETNNGMLSGSMAVFVKSGSGYSLRMIIDMR